MRKRKLYKIGNKLLLLSLAAVTQVLMPGNLFGKAPVDWVDPLIDTDQSRWFYFNSASRPFGMVNLSPDTETKGSWKSGYLYGHKKIRCFSHIHAWQLSGVPVLPIKGEMTGHQGMDAYQSEFSHDDEVVAAGYHKVVLRKYDITAELTSTTRVGFHRYRYPKTKDAYVLVDAGALLAHAPMVDAKVKWVSETQLEGFSLMGQTRRRKKPFPVYFVIEFDRPMTAFGGWEKNGKTKSLVSEKEEISGRDSGAYARFDMTTGEPLLMKVAISYTSIEGARRNLDAELRHWDFDKVVRESRNEWNSRLSRIAVEGGTDAQKTKFYTDLWRAMLGRRIVSDVDGAYRDMTGKEPEVRKVPLGEDGKPRFAMHNFDAWWGSHWSLNILWPLLCPEVYSDFCSTSVEMFKHGGLIPRGPSGGNYTFVMIGDHATPAITAAYAKGIRDFDVEKALEGLVRNTEPDGGRYYGGYAGRPTRRAYDDYNTKGYIPFESALRGLHGKSVSSLTLYNAYHDWCIAQMAAGLGKTDIHDRFIKGASNYQNVIWSEKQSAWVRMKDGSWKPNFRPTGGGARQDGFCETSAAVATFYVPHDPMGLARMMGGPQAAAEKLNGQFEAAEGRRFVVGHNRHGGALVDYGNQEGTGAAHYFNRIGYSWLTQKWARAVQEKAFSGITPRSGYNGDEDQGQMGALSALLAMGLFQFDGGSGIDSSYDITAPVFEKVVIRLSEEYYGGSTVTILAENQGPKNIYIQSATWNGTHLANPWLPHKELVRGGTLKLTLGPNPNKELWE
ncbi:MAG TPA: GH92 family glycosyl hydrolase [Opitutales bacterium]|nr:GH92 family glycosyl hydrolase [Opitutales bacterium]